MNSSTHNCNICGAPWDDFQPVLPHLLDLPGTLSENEKPLKADPEDCPKCRTPARGRLLYHIYAVDRAFFRTRRCKILIIGALFRPELQLINVLRERNEVVLMCDIDHPHFPKDVKADIQDMPYEDESFDMVMHFHVLEHVEDDIKALAECKRILKPNGCMIVCVPMSKNEDTFYDPAIQTPEDRFKYYWWHDHKRLYGQNFPTKVLPENGWCVEEFMIPARDMEMQRIHRNNRVFIGYKA